MDFSYPWNGSDVVLKVEDKLLHVHKNMLSLWSPVFERMFNSNYVEKEAAEVKLKDKSFDQVERMLKIMYDRRQTVTDCSVGFLLALADEYQMEQLYSECVKHIESSKEPLKHLNLIIQYNLSELRDTCLSEVERMNSKDLENTKEYKDLDESVRYMIAKKRVNYLEGQLKQYNASVNTIVRYMYGNANKAFEDFLRQLGLEESVFSKCDLHDEHFSVRADIKFDLNCTLCRKRICASKQVEVNTKHLLEILEPLYLLNEENTN